MTLQEIIAGLEAFVSSGDETDDVARLYDILEGFEDCPGRTDAVPAMFGLLERYPDTILGSPGPIVHELEAIVGYESALRESMLRKPSCLTVWMVNRILNTNLPDDERRKWQHLLERAADHASSPHLVREEAAHFIGYRRSEGRWLGA